MLSSGLASTQGSSLISSRLTLALALSIGLHLAITTLSFNRHESIDSIILAQRAPLVLKGINTQGSAGQTSINGKRTGKKILPVTEDQQVAGNGGQFSENQELESGDMLFYVAPVYSRIAIARELEGELVVKFQVGDSGKAEQVQIQASSGHALLDQSALNAVERWVFNANIPRGVWFTKKVIFKLK